jgi:hypothetical protein
MSIDKNGCELNIGDRVKSSRGYEFTIEVINGGWIWGRDLPEPYYMSGGREYENSHNPEHCEKIQYKTSWDGSIIKFNFTQR